MAPQKNYLNTPPFKSFFFPGITENNEKKKKLITLFNWFSFFFFFCVLRVCDIVLMFKFEFVFFVFGSGFVLYVLGLMFKSVIVFLCVFVQNELDLN